METAVEEGLKCAQESAVHTPGGHFVIYVNGAKSDTRETAGFLPFPVSKRPNKK